MKKVNSIAINRDKYKTEEEFYVVIGKVVGMLMDLGQVLVCRYEDCSVYVIEFDDNDAELGGPLPLWLTPEERESVIYEDDTTGQNDCGEDI